MDRRPCALRWPGRICWAVALACLLQASQPARSETLVADLSEHLIAITTAFVGTDVVLFGTTGGSGDVIVTVHGPRVDQVVRRKARMGGIWINRELVAFGQVPDYYAVASSRPLNEIARPDVMARLEIGIDHLALEAKDTGGLGPDEIAAFREALVRRKQIQGLYSVEVEPVRFVGPSLFRTTLRFPANVPPGIYQVQVFQLADGFVDDAQRSSLIISKVGFEADVFDFAQTRSALYGLAAVAIALLSGWLAGLIFRRD
jgi:uncharacterized protein (TIGR02186 family)